MKHIKTFEKYNSKPKTYTVTDIIYDADDANDIKDLPKTLKITIPDNLELEDDYEISEYISDEISNITGFCHKGFSTDPALSE